MSFVFFPRAQRMSVAPVAGRSTLEVVAVRGVANVDAMR